MYNSAYFTIFMYYGKNSIVAAITKCQVRADKTVVTKCYWVNELHLLDRNTWYPTLIIQTHWRNEISCLEVYHMFQMRQLTSLTK